MNFQKQLLLLLITSFILLTVDALAVTNESIQVNQTSLSENSKINSTSSEAAVKFECPSKFGYYATADGTSSNMTKFWLCVNFEAHEFTCPRGTHFNVHENQCTEWISESSTREDASEAIQHLGQNDHHDEHEQRESNHPHHQKKTHRKHRNHHKQTRRHHKHHHQQQQQQHRDHQQLERMHRRMDEMDNRLDSLFAYVDFKLRQTEPSSKQPSSA